MYKNKQKGRAFIYLLQLFLSSTISNQCCGELVNYNNCSNRLEKLQRSSIPPSERVASFGIMGAQLSEPLEASQQYGIEGLKGAPQLGSHYSIVR